jgi:hypothetical protein
MIVFKRPDPNAPPPTEVTWLSAIAFLVIAFAVAGGWVLLRDRLG